MANKAITTSRAAAIKPLDESLNLTCRFIQQHSQRNWGKTYSTICGKKATHTNGGKNLCRHHTGLGRYVLRVGDVGEILARFNTKEELFENCHLFPDARLQKITKSHRADYNRPITQPFGKSE